MPNLDPRTDLERVAATVLPADGLDAREAYAAVHDEMMVDGNARMNLATFVTTWMEPVEQHGTVDSSAQHFAH